MTLYLRIPLAHNGLSSAVTSLQVVEGRAEATEFVRTDADTVRSEARRRLPKGNWQIERTYRGKYVVHGEKDE
jgi:hypothetical protein